jgi:guanosine-3',5'-bis(diphosphate) 3'-pyrophosphohydrolase
MENLLELRIERLKRHVASLRVSDSYKTALYESLVRYREALIERPARIDPEEGLNDIEALHQVTMGDALENWFKEIANRKVLNMADIRDSGRIGLVFKALSIAANKHSHQRRKDAVASPYINHPIALVDVLYNEGGVTDVDVLCAAILHDTIEDTDMTAIELEKEHGKEICGLVLEVSDDKSLPKAERKILQIEKAAKSSHKAKLIKLADKICNVRDLSKSPPVEWTSERKLEYFFWAKKVVDQIRGTHPILEKIFEDNYEQGIRLVIGENHNGK